MIHAVRTLLVHGMGQSARWWDPLLHAIEQAGIAPEPLRMPSLRAQGPEAWVDRVVQFIDNCPTVLIGHSLGAAVVLEASRRVPVDACLLLALPGNATAARAPEDTCGLSATALARVALFLLSTGRGSAPNGVQCIHFHGADDPAVAPAETPDGCERATVEGAGHDLNGCRALAGQLRGALCRLRVAAQWVDPGVRFTYGLDQTHPPGRPTRAERPCAARGDPTPFPGTAVWMQTAATIGGPTGAGPGRDGGGCSQSSARVRSRGYRSTRGAASADAL